MSSGKFDRSCEKKEKKRKEKETKRKEMERSKNFNMAKRVRGNNWWITSSNVI